MVMRGGCRRGVDIEICNCRGHKDGHKITKHAVACCAGECVGCGKPIRSEFIEEHREKCEQYKLVIRISKQP